MREFIAIKPKKYKPKYKREVKKIKFVERATPPDL